MLKIILNQVMIGTIGFIAVYFIFYLAVVARKKKLTRFIKGTEAMILKKIGKVDIEKFEPKKLGKILVFANAISIGIVFGVVTVFDNLWISMIVGFIMSVPLILIVYKIFGLILQKKEVKHNV